jgi:Ca-activated chloride channel family protein
MRALVVSAAIALAGIPAAFSVRSALPPSVPAQQPASTQRAVESASAPGVVTGVVSDLHGAARSGVRVELLCDDRPPATTRTDGSGRFTFERVAPGICEVRASSDGLAAATAYVAITDLPSPPVRLSLGVGLADGHADVWAGNAARQAGSRVDAAAGGVPGGVAGGVVGGLAESMAAAPPPASAPASGEARRAVVPPIRPMPPGVGFSTAAYDRIDESRFRRVADEPLSTVSTDVDTASYSNVRRFLNRGTLPPADAVRIEELVNYFRFPYDSPHGSAPVAIASEVAPCPWNPRHRLALIGIQARRDDPERAARRNLVFLLDVSGSMTPPERLPLVKAAMRMLVDTLSARDRVAIVVYAGASGLVLPSTPGDRKPEIHAALDRLQAGGSTNGAAGIQLAYDTAASALVEGGVNRVVLATDGDFNVGVTSQGELVRLIEQQRERGIFLSVLGVGDDNLKDSTMEKLADRGNGNYAYLDSLDEARRVLIAEASSTLVTVAKDVKVQIEFNPRRVGAYRLVGYENRLLNREDFNDDRKDGGDVGAGHTVTALYELVPPGEPVPGASAVDPLKYQDTPRAAPAAGSDELMTVKLRYKEPDASSSERISAVVRDRTGEPTATLGFAAAVAQFGMLLRDSEFKGTATWSSVQQQARRYGRDDPDGYRAEFIRLVDLAAALQGRDTVLETRR